MDIIEVDMFSEDVNSPEHPVAESFRELLEEVAASYRCKVLFFNIKRGTVMFSFDNDELTAEIIKLLKSDDST
jgi:hypothetical protein